jgi:pimeloyl-ACP methyl ester carboxylesterase
LFDLMRALALASTLTLACAPPATSEGQLPGASGRDVWVLVVHGSGDGPDRWATPMVDALRPRVVLPERVELIAYDWRDAAVDKLAAAGNGRREGRAIAEVISARGLAHVHVIAHSAGAHVAHGLELALAEQPSRPTLHLTLLDPFLGEGLDFEWGATRFGAKADFTEDLFNRGDGVPGTDVVVEAAHGFDVTDLKPEGTRWAGKEGHWWPTQAYLDVEARFATSLEAHGSFDVAALRARWPAGETE